MKPRPALADIPAYRPGRSAEIVAAEHGLAEAIKLASNELPFGPLPSVGAAIADAIDDVALYPDHGALELRAAIAAHHDVAADRVTVGAGSVGLLQQLALAYVDPGEPVAFCWPSFEAYPVFAALVGATTACPALRRQTYDLPALASAVDERTRLVLIANPNNPTGTAVGLDDLARFLADVPPTCLVVVDEAYGEFVTDPRVRSATELLDRFDNVVVLRTFSKAYGLAGCRIGYALAAPSVIDALDRTLVPFVVNALGQRAALASLAAGDEMRERVTEVIAERTRVVDRLRRSGWCVPEPHGNFVWLPCGATSVALGTSLERLGVVTRVFADTGIRVTIADPARNDRFLEAFEQAGCTDGWQLPTGSLAVRIADELARLDDALTRLERHAVANAPDGLTSPDAATGERWDVGQVWAHLAEFGAYWRAELAMIVDSTLSDPVPFGRTKRDPHRIAMIEQHRGAPVEQHLATVRADIAALRADLAELTATDWQRRGRHETLGEMDLWTFLEHFATGHYAEHADQLDELRGAP